MRTAFRAVRLNSQSAVISPSGTKRLVALLRPGDSMTVATYIGPPYVDVCDTKDAINDPQTRTRIRAFQTNSPP
jgi:hypothetical protein